MTDFRFVEGTCIIALFLSLFLMQISFDLGNEFSKTLGSSHKKLRTQEVNVDDVVVDVLVDRVDDVVVDVVVDRVVVVVVDGDIESLLSSLVDLATVVKIEEA
ncbi:transmembrane protein, putative [Medicago truncatula]|uniref:Transmembrane protein, putative n=1 Tax=Medicago truncatula TaxID=3880 RepID=A0A072V8A5_MEDTR|nr:transmembrane protein, putative [Medicago truncatula]